eukprot:5235660-Amphidinium_carterae.1
MHDIRHPNIECLCVVLKVHQESFLPELLLQPVDARRQQEQAFRADAPSFAHAGRRSCSEVDLLQTA